MSKGKVLLKAVVISVGPAGPQNATLADVTYYGTVRSASEAYGKYYGLLELGSRPQYLVDLFSRALIALDFKSVLLFI